jgi:hypothetical protein
MKRTTSFVFTSLSMNCVMLIALSFGQRFRTGGTGAYLAPAHIG